MTLDMISPVGGLVALAAATFGFVLKRYVEHSVIPAASRQRESVQGVTKTLVLHAPCIFNPGDVSDEKAKEASNALRESAAELVASVEGVRFYRALTLFGIVRSRKAVTNANHHLIGLSNSTRGDSAPAGYGKYLQNATWVKEVEDALGLKTSLGFRKDDLKNFG